jgi:DNA helicase-2/ATP-dependent DNA helicase PcrA
VVTRSSSERDLIAWCDQEQVEAITTPARPLCVLAGAGSGKTRVLTRRMAWRVFDGSAKADHVLALTFTRKAAGELRGRLADLGLPQPVTAGTFHAIALAELKRRAAEHSLRPPVVLSSKVRLLYHVLGDRGRRVPAPKAVAELATEIEWAKAGCVAQTSYEQAVVAARRTSSWRPGEVAEIWKRYELEKRKRGVLDFEDLLQRCEAELRTDAEFAASARWRYRHLFVDEFQDVNEAQLRLLRAWLGQNDDLCVVGDPHQAIYSWNGADPGVITHFTRHFHGATVLTLGTNYRSTREVLGVAAAALGARHPATAGGPVPEGKVPTVTACRSELDEAASVAAAARLAKRPGRAWSDIAVLARTNGQLGVLEEAFSAAGIPTRLARTRWEPGSTRAKVALDEAVAAPNADALARWAADIHAAALTGPGSGDEMAELELGELAVAAIEYIGEDVSPSGVGFCNWLETTAPLDAGGRLTDAVELATFHRAKGLEWEVVFVTGLEDGLVPISHAREAAAIAEERRLLYVACTRAAEELHCSWAAERTFSSALPSPRSPSPWLSAIEEAARELRRVSRASSAAAQQALAESRRLLGMPVPAPAERPPHG